MPASINEIYRAFNSSSHQIFRVAMSLSRGSVVRVDDLILAIVKQRLAPAQPELTSPSSAIESLSSTLTGPTVDEHAAPMSNEPALRVLLQRAFELARDQPGTRYGVITPACLAFSILEQRAWLSPEQLNGQREALGLADSTRNVRAPKSTERMEAKTSSTKAGIDEALELWLRVQQTKNPQEVSDSLKLLTKLVRVIESHK